MVGWLVGWISWISWLVGLVGWLVGLIDFDRVFGGILEAWSEYFVVSFGFGVGFDGLCWIFVLTKLCTVARSLCLFRNYCTWIPGANQSDILTRSPSYERAVCELCNSGATTSRN